MHRPLVYDGPSEDDPDEKSRGSTPGTDLLVRAVAEVGRPLGVGELPSGNGACEGHGVLEVGSPVVHPPAEGAHEKGAVATEAADREPLRLGQRGPSDQRPGVTVPERDVMA